MPTFDLHHVPFSRAGAYLAISQRQERRVNADGMEFVQPAGLYLRTMHGNASHREALLLAATAAGEPVPAMVNATEDAVRLAADAGTLTLAFEDAATLRVGGVGLGVHCSIPVGRNLYLLPVPGGRVRLIDFTHRLKLLFTPLCGSLRWSAPVSDAAHHGDADHRPQISIDLLPDAQGRLEVAIEPYQTEWSPREYVGSAEDCAAQAKAEFAAWQGALPGAPEEFAEARALAAYVDWSAIVRPEGHLARPAMLMSKNHMTNVWSWDHCFNALALAGAHPALAWDQFMLFFDHQAPDGALADVINDTNYVWEFVKPPVHGWALRGMLARQPAFGASQLAEAYGPLSRWTNFWLTRRDDHGNGLAAYYHGNDSGWDNATAFDIGYPLEAPDLAAYLTLQMDVLADIATRLARHDEAARWRAQADAMLDRLVTRLWDGHRFFAQREDGATSDLGDCLLPFLPIVLGRRLPAQIAESLVAGLREEGRFLTPHGLATESVRSPYYTPNGYWRGPIWAPSAYLIIDGLRDLGEDALARDIAIRFCRTCAASGFAENFDAETGAGLRDRAYTWTSSVFLLLASEVVGIA